MSTHYDIFARDADPEAVRAASNTRGMRLEHDGDRWTGDLLGAPVCLIDRHDFEQIAIVLREGWVSAREISERVGLSEREVEGHLPHVERSAKGKGERFETDPARCLACDHAFEGRRKKRTPSRCPACKSERIRRARHRST